MTMESPTNTPTRRRRLRRELIRPAPGGIPSDAKSKRSNNLNQAINDVHETSSMMTNRSAASSSYHTYASHPSQTPPATRAHNAKRRLQVWMQQTWRQRNIPIADFESKKHDNASLQHSETAFSTPTKGDPRRFNDQTLQHWKSPNQNPSNSSFSTRPQSPITKSTVEVSNVDEALQAWTDLYKFQDCFPVSVESMGDEISNGNHVASDWILDGHPEWQEAFRKSDDLLKKLYPVDQNWMASIRSQLLQSENDERTSLGVDSESDEKLVLLKLGSAMGQQEYQFAAFDQAEFESDAINAESVPVDRGSSGEPNNGFEIGSNDNVRNDESEENCPMEGENNKALSLNAQPSMTAFSPNFEVFWQTAINAPTPETGTYPSIDSRSTYVTSPSVLSVEEDIDDDAAVSKSTPSVAHNSITIQNDYIAMNERMSTRCSIVQDGIPETELEEFENAPSASQTDKRRELSLDFPADGSCLQHKGLGIGEKQSRNNPHENGSEKMNIHLNETFCDENKGISIDTSYDDDDLKNVSFESTSSKTLQNTSFETAVATTMTIHTGITPLKKNGRCSTPITPGSDPNNGGFQTPRASPPTNGTFSRQQIVASSSTNQNATTPIAGVTPVASNFHYTETLEVSSPTAHTATREAARGGRSMLMIPNTMKSPERFQLTNIQNIMNGENDEQSVKNAENFDNVSTVHDEETEVEESSLPTYDGSLQSGSIPSVVQLFTQSIGAQERKNDLVVPDTVRAANRTNRFMKNNENTNRDPNSISSTAVKSRDGLRLPTFYLGRNSSLYTSSMSSNNIDSIGYDSGMIQPDTQDSSIGFMSLRRMIGIGSNGKTTVLDEDIPSISSSIASPEVKFLRRHRKSSRSLASLSKTSHSIEGDSNYLADHQDSDDSDEFNDEESLSLGSLSTMPRQYWNHPEMDHTLQELTKLEWDWLPYWQMNQLLDDLNDDDRGLTTSCSVSAVHEDDSNNKHLTTANISLLQDQITQQLSKLDSFYGKICKKVYKKIQPHAEELLSANQAALDLQKNLQLAHMYLSKSRRSISLAKDGKDFDEYSDEGDDIDVEGIGVQGAVKLLELWDIQQSYQELDGVEKVISSICALEENLQGKVRSFDTYRASSLDECDSILALAQTFLQKLSEEPTKGLICFDEARKRAANFVAETFLQRLHECLAEITVECCSGHYENSDIESSRYYLSIADRDAYSRLLRVLINVNRLLSGNSGETAKELPKKEGFVQSICTTIQTSIIMETQKAFGRALLDPTASENETSEYEEELIALSSNERHLDDTRLPIWKHNLVTIRFDFEMKQGEKLPLPGVFHKLCFLLTNILMGAHRLIDWHASLEDNGDHSNGVATDATLLDVRTEIRKHLRSRRASIWNCCIQSIEECLEEYMKYSGKKSLFSRNTKEEHFDSSWRNDLEGLYYVGLLSNQFLSLRLQFLQGVPTEVVNDGSMINEKLFCLFKTHLRSTHVEAMNTLGQMFYREDWTLFSIGELVPHTLGVGKSNRCIDDPLQTVTSVISERLKYPEDETPPRFHRRKLNEFTVQQNKNDIDLFSQSRNPFEVREENIPSGSTSRANTKTDDDEAMFSSSTVEQAAGDVLALIRTCIGMDHVDLSKMILRSVFDGIFPWTARILLIMEKLPMVRDEATNVLIAIYDLYITTAFRVCAGNAANERALLRKGSSCVQSTLHNGHNHGVPSSSQALFGFGLRSMSGPPVQNQHGTTSNQFYAAILATAEADLCALVPEEMNELDSLQELLFESKKRMEGIAKLDLVNGWIVDPILGEDTIEEEFAEQTARTLEKREAASFNYLLVALGLSLAGRKMRGKCSKEFMTYSDQFLKVTPLLVKMCNRISCMRSIRGKALLQEIVSVGSVWQENKLHENPNEYVDDFCGFLALLWRYLSSCSRPLPEGIRKLLWENLIGGGYMVLLDGFSRVPSCSTEGRALMSMDVASYRSGTCPRSIASRLEENQHPSSPLPKDIQPYRTMAYVDTYIKLFYFPASDAIDWIKKNYQYYHQRHLLALVINDRDASNLVKQVMKCYDGNAAQAKLIRV